MPSLAKKRKLDVNPIGAPNGGSSAAQRDAAREAHAAQAAVAEEDDNAAQINATFKSTLFCLQVRELLKEVALDSEREHAIEECLQSLESVLQALPEGKKARVLSPSLISPYAAGLGVSEEHLKGVQLLRPRRIEVVGSFAAQTVARPEVNVDVAIQLPKGCFHEKDYLGHRYHARRSLYLAGLVVHMQQKHAALGTVSWTLLRQDPRKPLLVLTPPGPSGVSVRLIPTLSPDTFDVSKLAPARCNLRSSADPGVAQVPSPLYSASIAEDLVLAAQSQWLQAHHQHVPALREATLLLKVWARQRGMTSAPDTLNGYLLSLLAAHLATPGAAGAPPRVSPHMSAYQILRVVLDALSSPDFLLRGVYLRHPDGSGGASAEQRQAMAGAYSVVLCEPSGCVNLAARVSASAVAEVRGEAAMALTLLRAEGNDQAAFDALFLTPVDPAAKYDMHVRVARGGPAEGIPSSLASADLPSWRQEEARVEALLGQGLTERAELVRCRRRGVPASWRLEGGGVPEPDEGVAVRVALSAPEVAFRLADVGPSAEKKEEAKAFRTFWGAKAELRRFKDGTVCESAVWECADPSERHLVLERLVTHVLCHHLPTFPSRVHCALGQLDDLLTEDGQDPSVHVPALLATLDVLSKRLRSLPGLPLKVTSMQPLSQAFRHTAVFPPSPHPLAWEGGKGPALKGCPVRRCLEPQEVLLQLEGSGKWPEDPQAVQKLKSAFLLQIAEGLAAKFRTPCVPSKGALDVLMSGFAFRLLVGYEKDPSHVAGVQGVPLEKDQGLRSLHASWLQGLQGQHPVFGPTARLAQRWVGAHLFSAALHPEAVELLVAALFCPGGVSPPPRTRLVGFLRFLRQLATHSWQTHPLLVDPHGELAFAPIQNHFESLRAAGAGPALFLATPYDPHSATWTSSTPSADTLRRLAAYARSSAELLTGLLTGAPQAASWRSLFRTPAGAFHAIVRLRQDALPSPERALHSLRTPGVKQGGAAPAAETEGLAWLPGSTLREGRESARGGLVVGMDPVGVLVQLLQERCGPAATFWADAHSGTALGITFGKELSTPAPLRAPLAHCCTPTGKQEKESKKRKGPMNGGSRQGSVFGSAAAIFEDVKVIGHGLVEDVCSLNPWA